MILIIISNKKYHKINKLINNINQASINGWIEMIKGLIFDKGTDVFWDGRLSEKSLVCAYGY